MKGVKPLISPNVEIYKFPITAISSITNRVFGLGLTGAFTGTGLLGLAGINPFNEIDSNSQKMINYVVSFPLCYHTYGGIRHFIWDRYPKFLCNRFVGKSSVFLLASSVVTTIAINEMV